MNIEKTNYSSFYSNQSLTYLYKITELSDDTLKLSPMMTFFTLMKGFVGTAVLYLPREVFLGGWLTSLVSLTLSLMLSFYCANLLLEAQKDSRGRGFMDIGQKAYGEHGKWLVGSFLILTQASFCLAFVYFIGSQMGSVIFILFGLKIPLWVWGCVVFVIQTPLQMVRDLTKFAKYHLFADFVILITVVSVIVFAVIEAAENGWGNNAYAVNPNSWVTMIGYSVFVYEGIGLILPVQSVCEDKKVYPKIVFSVMFTLFLIYFLYGFLVLQVYGDRLTSPLILDMIPHDNPIIICIKIVYCMNIVITFPLTINPAVETIEDFLYAKKKYREQVRRSYENFDRMLLIGIVCVVAVILGENIDKFLALLGAFACVPVAFTMPALFHYRLSAKTKKQQIVDLLIIGLSIIIAIFTTILTLKDF